MTVKEVDRLLCYPEPIPCKLCGIAANRLYSNGHEYTRVAALTKRRTSKGEIFFEAELVDERGGRCHSTLHVDINDVDLADSVSPQIRQKIFFDRR